MNDSHIFYSPKPMVSVTTNNNVTSKKVATVNNLAQKNVQFKNVLQQELDSIKFSQHAKQRLEMRNITLDSEQMERLKSAIDKAATKGASESLVLMDNQLAFVVSVRNRTVITAMDGTSIKDNIFTNIDSAIVM